MKITILGCGAPTPLPEAFGTSHVVEVAGQKLLFDCGPASTHKMVKAGISPADIDHLFFSHHHYDHDSDFGTFLMTRWDHIVPEDRPLNIYGPRATQEFTEETVEVFRHDWTARINHVGSQDVYSARGGKLPRKRPQVRVAEIGPGAQVEGKGWTVTAAHAQHVAPWLDSLAYRVDSGGKSVVLTGDTAPCPEVTDLARGADILMMMCWDLHDMLQGSEPARGSASVRGCAETAASAGVRQLVMVHVGPGLRSGPALEKREKEAASSFHGSIIWGEELMEIPWPD